MTCFCDIPISRISEHTAFYGDYGIGMTKEWGRRNSLHPLLYAVPGAVISESISTLVGITEAKPRDSKKVEDLKYEASSLVFELIPYVKPIVGKMIVAGAIVEKDFSQENEWRYVPDHDTFLFKNNFEERRAELDIEMEKKIIQFSPCDVKYIFVKSDHEIPAIFDFIQRELGRFPLNDLKILTSRIVSLETLSPDI